MKKHNFKKMTKFPTLNVSFDVTQEVAATLNALRATGFYGNGVDCASVAEELLRLALRDPEIVPHWHVPGRNAIARAAEGRAPKRRRRS